MTKKALAIILIFSVFSLTTPWDAFGLNPTIPIPDSGSTSIPGRLSCTGFWAKAICIIKKIADLIKTITKITKFLSFVPHGFPFGGHILTSERACSLKFDEYTFISGQLTYCTIIPIPSCFQFGAGPVPITIPLGGRAIRVGTPTPIVPPTTSPYGRAIVFPWISDVYKNHQEKRVGPWALGLGFTPFPLRKINAELGSIKIRFPLNQLSLFDPPCWTPIWPNGGSYTGVCIDNIRFDCKDSGEYLPNGDPVYKVIRKLGTAP